MHDRSGAERPHRGMLSLAFGAGSLALILGSLVLTAALGVTSRPSHGGEWVADLALLSPVAAVLGVVLGHRERRRSERIGRSAERALVGLILGYVTLGLLALIILFLALEVILIPPASHP